MRPRMHNCQSQKEARAKLRRSHGLRLRLRRSLTTLCISKRSSTRECSRRSQRSSALPEPYSARSSRSVDQSPVLSSRTFTRRPLSPQSEINTTHSTCTRVPSQRLQLKRPLKMLPSLKPRTRERRHDPFWNVHSWIRSYYNQPLFLFCSIFLYFSIDFYF